MTPHLSVLPDALSFAAYLQGNPFLGKEKAEKFLKYLNLIWTRNQARLVLHASPTGLKVACAGIMAG